MKRMLDYDFVVSACWGGGGDEHPTSLLTRPVTRIIRIFVPHGNRREASGD